LRALWLVVAYWLCGAAAAAPWIANVDPQGLPALSRGGGPALTSGFGFWGANWAWAEQETKLRIERPLDYSLSGKNPALGFELAARIRRVSERELAWEFDLNARAAKPSVIGGGIVFRFDLANFAGELGEPELLAGNRGWAWGRRGTRVEMRFEPPLEALYFERGAKSELRAFFYKDRIPAGARRHVATLSVSGDIAIGPTAAERFGLDDPAAWPTAPLDWKSSPVDLSFLNAREKPAGRRGFLKVVHDRLVFEDGTEARFWGTNLTAYALFATSRDGVRQQARRLSQLGFNLVRLVHHDSAWVDPNVFGERSAPDTQSVRAEMLDKLDWWVRCLKDEGIYVWLDLHVGRELKPGDRIDAFDEITKARPAADLRGYNYVNPSIQAAMKRFNQAYTAHYKDEPAVVAMLITNENDATQHFGNSLLPDKKVPRHAALYRARADAFAAASGLPKDKTWRSWEHGPSKLFLNDLEHSFGVDMIAHLRSQGVKVPLVTTSTWGLNPLSSLPALTAGDIIDVHSYGGVGELEKNPLYFPNLVHWIAAAQVAGRPLSVTEWNVEAFPAPDRHSVPLYVAAVARHQGWRALMHYAYAQVPLDSPGDASNWHAFNDPALLATLPAAALLYRRGDVREASTVYALAPGRELFSEAISPQNSIALRTAPERGKLVIALPAAQELPWLQATPLPPGAKVVSDHKQNLIAWGARESVSDTGELSRNWEEGIYTIDTPRTQAAMGWIGGRRLALADVEITATTRNATVAVQSLDDAPIAKAKAILVSLSARAVPRSAHELPYYSEPVRGELAIRAPKGLTLYQGNKALPAPYVDGAYRLRLERELGTRCLILRQARLIEYKDVE